jgi:hypothetical protein|tara:strand:+ start:838 stop:1239 length:402 start_codon:yes stop_codon:yes gene_type:complete
LNSDRLKEIFEESLTDSGSVNLSGKGYEARMRLGIKISRDMESGDIMLYDHTSGGNYYVEMREEDQVIMESEGWLRGVFIITLDKYKGKLERIKQGISTELNGNNSKKRLNFYKEARKQILNKYYKVTQKLNN